MAQFIQQQDVSQTIVHQVSDITSNSRIMRPSVNDNSEDLSITFENQNQLRVSFTQQQKIQMIKNQIDRWIITIIAYLIFFVLIALSNLIENSIMNWEFVFFPLWLLDLYIFWNAFSFFKQGNQAQIQKTRTLKRVYLKDIIDTFFIITFKAMICITIRIDKVPPILIGVPLYLGWFFRVILCAWPKSDCWSFSSLIRSTGRFFRILICITVTLKIQGIIKWEWTAIFWPFWVVFALLLLINIGVWLLFCGSVCSYIMGDTMVQEIAVNFWLFYITSGACIVSSLIAYDFGLLFEGMSHKSLWKIMMPVIFYLLFLLFFTRFVYPLLPTWWNAFFHQDSVEFGDTLPTEVHQQNSQRNQMNQRNDLQNSQEEENNQQGMLSERSAIRQVINQIKKPPKYLIRMSSTYFGRPANLAFNRILHYNQKASDLKMKQNESKELKLTDIMDETIAKDDNFHNSSIEQKEILKKKRNISMPQKLEEFSNQIKIPSLVVSPRRFRNCCVCFETLADAVIMECGHGGICYNCSLEMWKSTGECHLCRELISQVVQCDFTKPGRFVKVFSATRAIFGDQNDSSDSDDIQVQQERESISPVQQIGEEQLNQNEEEKVQINNEPQQEGQQESCTNISILSIEEFSSRAPNSNRNIDENQPPTLRNNNITYFNQ